MPTSTLTLSGSLALQAPSYPPSAAQQLGQPIAETMYVQSYDVQAPTLSADGATPIPFPIGTTQIHYLQLKVQGGSPVILQITSADGTLQSIPVDSFIALQMLGTPATAISVTRTPGVSTPIAYVIAQKA